MFRKSYLIVLFIGLLFVFLLPQDVFAQNDVIINEFLVEPDAQQWVELFNQGVTSVDISGWFIDDNGGTQKFTIPSGTSIAPGEFKVFESSSFNLNTASADEVRLFNGATIEDSYAYNKSPGNGISYGRVVDGSNSWGIFANPTKGSTNNVTTPLPTATATPTEVPTPTRTPTPTKVPTPTHTPTPTKSPTPTKVPTSTNIPTSTKIPTQSPTHSASSEQSKTSLFVSPATNSAYPNAVLGASTSAYPTPPKREVKTLVKSSTNNPIGAVTFIIAAVFFIACGILVYWQKRRKYYE